MLKLWKKKSVQTHEDLFVKYYKQTLKWALQITGNNRQRAEDLVHDVFIQFAISQPNIEEIDNLEGYLFAMLRNLMRSKLRSEARTFGKNLSIEKYESAQIGLDFIDTSKRLEVRGELLEICKFLCERKESSKSGSILLLRYFLGYFRSEIQLITRSSENAVDYHLSNARREARLFIDQPEKLTFFKKETGGKLKEALKSLSAKDDETFGSNEKFIQEIKTRIFQSCQGICFTREDLEELYQKPGSDTIPTDVLAHICSCPSCLDKVNKILHLPMLKDRFPTDTLGRNNPDDPTGMSGGSGRDGIDKIGDEETKDALNKFRRSLREVIEHEPTELLVALNGDELGTLLVTSKVNKIKFNIEDVEKMNFVEIFSEQGFRLFFLNIAAPPNGSFERNSIAEFSRNRKFEVDVDFNGPTANIQVGYHHPHFVSENLLNEENAEKIKQIQPNSKEKESGNYSAEEKDSSKDSLFSSFSSNNSKFTDWFSFNKTIPIASVSLLLIAALIFIQIPQSKVSAAELLKKSTKSEKQLAINPEIALHRTFSLEQRDSNGGRLIEQRRMEVWQSAEKGLKIRRLYDQEGRLIVADWQRKDGSRTLYRPGDKPTEIKINSAIVLPNDLNDAWQIDLSADNFSKIAKNENEIDVQEKDDIYVLNFADNEAKNSRLVRASLKIEKETYRAIEQLFVLKVNGEEQEFRYSETKFEQPKLSEVPASVFEPEPELVPQEIELPKVETEESSSPSESPEDETQIESDSVDKEVAKEESTRKEKEIVSVAQATSELEIDVISALDGIGATLGNEVVVKRTEKGLLRIEGIVADEKRKNVVLKALSKFKGRKEVIIRIETPDEAQYRLSTSNEGQKTSRIKIEDVKPSTNKIAADKEVREFFQRQGVSGENLDKRINRFSNGVLSTSRQAKLHAWTMRKYAKRFSVKKIEELKGDARKKWFLAIAGQAGNYYQKTSQLRKKIAPVVGGNSKSSGSSAGISDINSLMNAIERLNQLNVLIDKAVRSSFTLSNSKSSPIKGAEFWRNLTATEALAKSIEQGAKRLSSVSKN